MAFGKISKEDLVAAGLDPEEIKASLKAVKDGSATKEDLTNVTNALNTITESIKGLETKFAENNNRRAENNGNNDGNNSNNGNNSNGNGNGNNQPKDIFTRLDENAMDFNLAPGTHLKEVATVLVNDSRIQTMSMRRDNAYEWAEKSLRYFNVEAIKAEVDDMWKKYTPQILVNTNSDPRVCIKQIYDSVVGSHYEDIQRDTAKKEGKFNVIQAGGNTRADNINNGGNNNGDKKAAKDILTPAELRAAEQFGMTPEEYLKGQEDEIAAGRSVRA
jgi:hypothetical protein